MKKEKYSRTTGAAGLAAAIAFVLFGVSILLNNASAESKFVSLGFMFMVAAFLFATGFVSIKPSNEVDAK
jgi:hypothetical protein